MEKNKFENIYEMYGTDKSCRMFIKMIAEQMQVEFMNDIRALRVLSVSSDVFPDSSVLKQEIAYIRFVYDGLPKTKFVNLGHFHKTVANNISSAIECFYKRLF